MKILLLGEYSNVHATLARGLRELGHQVTVASDGDGWKNYPRDIDLCRHSLGHKDTLYFLYRLMRNLPRFRGYDVVQLINPVFLPLKAEAHKYFYNYLRKNNRSMFMGAFGVDHYYVKTCLDCTTFRYSDFNFGSQLRKTLETEIWKRDWLHGAKGRWNQWVAHDCDGIIAGLYEYYASYCHHYPQKLKFIPFPLCPGPSVADKRNTDAPVRFFIGVQRSRNAYKGTDVMLRALQRTKERYPDGCEIVKVESVPFSEYVRLMQGSDVLLDQLYSYTPAMNALEAMSKGLVVVGGGEPENYEILGESELRPIVNVLPDEEHVYHSLCRIVEERSSLPELARQSQLYVERHHSYLKVAREYLDFWETSVSHKNPHA